MTMGSISDAETAKNIIVTESESSMNVRIIGLTKMGDDSNSIEIVGSQINFEIDGVIVETITAAGLVGAGEISISGVPVANDYARFTDADTIEGRDSDETLSDLGLFTPVSFQGYLAANKSIATGAWDVIDGYTEDWDSEGGFNPTTGRFQPTTAGYYLLSCGARLENLDNGELIFMQVEKNGSTYAAWQNLSPLDNAEPSVAGSIEVYFNGSSDYVDILIYHDHGSNLDATGAAGQRFTYFQGVRTR